MTTIRTEPGDHPTPHIAKLFELAADLLAVVSAEGRFTLVSPSWTRLLGWREDELLAMEVLDLIHPDDHRAAVTAMQEPADGAAHRDLLVRCGTADGDWRRIAWHVRWTGDGWYAAGRDVTEHQVLAHRALHDPLTGLPNRLALGDRLSVALARQTRAGTVVAVLFVDLDHFKLINDAHGHAVGDEVLRASADRIGAALRAADTVARLGGDEFVVLAEGLAGEDEAVALAERLIAGFAAPLEVAGEQLPMTPSVGIAVARAGTGRGPEDLLREADIAMYRAKSAGRGRAALYDARMSAAVAEQQLIAGELRHALDRGELWVAYQPIVALRDGTVTGVEALLHWDHPTRGAVEPTRFIPLAEENGLVADIGAWVLDQAVQQAARWRAAGRNLTVAVNVSTHQLLDPRFP
ncbi:MAG TPA: diguanylate cyclase, partial [Baekduia sp.]|nr:diguanylate cyclase [Baekduia sp.]